MNLHELLTIIHFTQTPGLTEGLPVSSSGHLVLLNKLFSNAFHSLSYDIFLHVATFFSVIVFFFKDIKALFFDNRKWILFIIVGTIPAGVIGVLFKDVIEELFQGKNSYLLSISFLITSFLVFYSGSKIKTLDPSKEDHKVLDIRKAFIIGVFQAFAIVPGISRSGATISAAILLGLAPTRAFVFSFLISLPAIGGAFILQLIKSDEMFIGIDSTGLIISFITAFAVGVSALYLLKNSIVKKHYKYFSYYTVVLAVLLLFLFV